MTANDSLDETALAMPHCLDLTSVPDMGYESWRAAQWARSNALSVRGMGRFWTAFCTPMAGFMLWLTTAMPGAPIFIDLVLYACIAMIGFFGPYVWIVGSRSLARLPPPEAALPPGSSPELAVREHELVLRIEAHNRNVRLLRGMPVIDPEELEKARNEERELRGGSLALVEAKSDIAGLLADAT